MEKHGIEFYVYLKIIIAFYFLYFDYTNIGILFLDQSFFYVLQFISQLRQSYMSQH